ncbi:MAG TPA: HAD family hydrolase [Gemmata sp.]|nr:HAD family hydrolase [Gemmata sp.]
MNTPPAELVNPSVRRGPFRAVLFDFDGTLSLIREGWPRVMVGMMIERLREQMLAREPESELWSYLDRLVMAQNGAPTIRQMEVFVEEMRRRGGMPADSWDYLRQYIDRLMEMVRGRWHVLETGQAQPADWAVPGVHALLGNLRNRQLPLFVASGTEYDHVAHEARILRVNEFFPTGINAPKNNDPSFRKANVIARVLAELGIRGEELLSFGDGMVETAEVKRVGGVAIGVASSEYGSGLGVVNATKRAALIDAGADLIIPDYSRQEELVSWLWTSD